MSNIKSHLVFDFPDPSPRFEFSDASPTFAPKKPLTAATGRGGANKLKNSKGFGKFKNQKVNNSNITAGFKKKSATDGSPDKSTATAATASESTFDESMFDDFDDRVFDFGKSDRNATGGNSNGKGGASSSSAVPDDKRIGKGAANTAATAHQRANTTNKESSKQQAAVAIAPSNSNSSAFPRINSNGSGTHYEFASGPTTSSKPLESPSSSSHKPLKLPNNHSANPHPYHPHHLHRRSPSSHSNISSGYVSEVSEFSFDRVTVDTAETPMTGASSNVSWNFFEETKDLLGDGNDRRNDGMFVPYTGDGGADGGRPSGRQPAGGKKGNGINIRSLLEGTSDSNNNSNNKKSRRKINVDAGNASLSDRSNEAPISGIVGSNQSIVSEISDANEREEGRPNDAVRMHPRGSDAAAGGDAADRRRTPSPSDAPGRAPRADAPTRSLRRAEGAASEPSGASNVLRDFREYRAKRSQMSDALPDREGGSVPGGKDAAGASTKKEDKNAFESLMSNVCIGLGFCSFYLCGIDTTQQNGNKEMTKEERQREMDETFLGKIIFCNCQDLNCGGMSAML